MRKVVPAGLFKYDYKSVSKRNLDMAKLSVFIDILAGDLPLPDNARPHKLAGKYVGTWECHVEPDWLLIYEYQENRLLLRRTGTHADLFR